jgi:hypothetical protein
VDNYGHLMNVEESFYLCPNIWALWKYPHVWNFLGSLKIFCLIFSGRLWRQCFFLLPTSQVLLSHVWKWICWVEQH